MKPVSHAPPLARPFLAWLSVALAGAAAPALALSLLVDAPAAAPLALVAGPILAVGLMGAGMIAAAAAGRLWIGVCLAVLTGTGLIMVARALGMAPLPNPFSTGLAVIIASISFAARGALFARSASDKGWLIAVLVVIGEAAVLFTAAALPTALPDWLLVLLPAQWASIAIQSSLVGTGTHAANSALIALAGTAAATLLVARLWPRRWPYVIMFTAWIGLSALVWHCSAGQRSTIFTAIHSPGRDDRHHPSGPGLGKVGETPGTKGFCHAAQCTHGNASQTSAQAFAGTAFDG